MAKKETSRTSEYYEYKDAKSHKFWEIKRSGKSLTVRFGRVGTDGQSRTKSFSSSDAARKSSEQLIKEKTSKGYKTKKTKASKSSNSPAKTAKKSTTRAAKKLVTKPANVAISAAKKKKAPKKPTTKPTPKAAALPKPIGSTRQLYMLGYDVFQGRQWNGDVVVMNCLETGAAGWLRQYTQRCKSKTKASKPLPLIVERHGRTSDCLLVGKGSPPIAMSISAWGKLRRLLDTSVSAVPAVTTHQTDAGDYAFKKLTAKQQTSYMLLDPALTIPFRHGQRLHWDRDKHKFEAHTQDKSLPIVPMIDPNELAGKHLFRLAYPAYVVASEEFVQAVQAAGISGLVFYPFQFTPTSKVRPPAAKKVLPAMPKYPTAMVNKGWSKPLGRQWESMWDSTTKGLKNRSWPAKSFKKTPPVSKGKLDAFERKFDVTLPPIFRSVLQYAASLEINHGRVNSSDPLAEYERVLSEKVGQFMFAGKQTLWDFRELNELESFQEYLQDVKEIEPDEMRTAPFLTASNGDQVTVDLETEQIRYWSTGGDESLDRPLAANMAEFITRWSWLGTPSIDFLPATPFYDTKRKCLHSSDSPAVKRWHVWLQGKDI